MPKANGGYWIAANRDELLTRSSAKLPKLFDGDGLTTAYPVDPDGGGTWIAANSGGLAATLLNAYDDERRSEHIQWVSRGEVVKRIVEATSLDEARARFDAQIGPVLEKMRAFTLLIVEPGTEEGPQCAIIRWNGKTCVFEDGSLPLAESSSSYDSQRVRESRLRQLRPLLGDDVHVTAAAADAHFGSHEPERGPYSICVHRDDAATVSHTRIDVSDTDISLRYVDGPLCDDEAEIHQISLGEASTSPASATGQK